MTSRLICRVGAVLALLGCSLGTARASDLPEFNAAVERAAGHNRVALGYLRTENVDLARLELERMQEAWGDVTRRFGKDRPVELRDNPLFVETLVDVPTRIVGTYLMLDMDRIDLARNSLQAVREELSALRRKSGITVLADCVLDANGAMAAFFAFDDLPPDWNKADAIADLTAKANALAGVAKRCDEIAPPDVRSNPEFRRLIDGTLASLTFVPKAIETRDTDLLHRVIGELRAFDNLLVFRYG